MRAALMTNVAALSPASGGGAPAAPVVLFAAMEAPGSSSTVTVTLAAGCPVGSMAMLFTSGFSAPAPVSATDSKGNTWTLDSQAFDSTACSGGVLRAPITTALVAGDTITITYGSSITKANVIAIAQAASTNDATGKGSNGSDGSSVTTWSSSTSGSPPTNAARVFMATYMTGSFDTRSISGGTWTLASGVAISGAAWNGMAVYYQDVAAGATSTLTVTVGSAITQWLDMWHSVDT